MAALHTYHLDQRTSHACSYCSIVMPEKARNREAQKQLTCTFTACIACMKVLQHCDAWEGRGYGEAHRL